jgi:hypothetical protein
MLIQSFANVVLLGLSFGVPGSAWCWHFNSEVLTHAVLRMLAMFKL